MTTREKIDQHLEENLNDDETVKLADGFESAYIGVARQFGKPIAVYDRDRCLVHLMKQGMSISEAQEWMGFNVEGAWVGENTPAFLERVKDEWEYDQAATLLTTTVRCLTAKEILKDLIRFVDPAKAANGPEERTCEEAMEAAQQYIALFPGETEAKQ
jgi:hypothetical protein